MAFTFDIKGMDKVQAALKQKPEQAMKSVRGVLAKYVTEINGEQVRLASRFTDRGAIVQGLFWAEAADGNFLLFSQAPHSAYMEFGTRKKFQPIAGVDASAYKGGGGSGGLFENILVWVKRKGIAEGTTYSVKARRKKGGKKQDAAERQAAFLIMREIMTNGVRPQPFFFGPFLSRKEEIIRAVEAVL